MKKNFMLIAAVAALCACSGQNDKKAACDAAESCADSTASAAFASSMDSLQILADQAESMMNADTVDAVAWDKLQTKYDELSAKADANAESLTEEDKTFLQKMKEKFEKAKTNVGGKMKDGGEAVKGAAEKVGEKASDVASDVKDGTKEAAEKVKDGTKKVVEDVKDGTKNATEKVKEGTKNATEKVKEGTKNAAEKVKGVFKKDK